MIGFFPRFFYKRDRFPNGFEWTDLEDLGAYRVGGVMGYWYNRSFQEAGLNVSYATTDMQSIRMLMKDRIHFTLIDELVGWALIEEAFPKERSAFSVAQKPESTDPFHLLISREYPDAKELTQQFNQGLKAIKESGIYQGILKQYDVPSEYAISQ